MDLSIGNGGWVRVDDPKTLPGPLYMRLQPDTDGRWRTVELYLDSQGTAITGEMMRRAPIARVEALFADLREQQDHLEQRINLPGVPMSVLASHYGHTFGSRATGWVADAHRSQIPGSGVKPAKRVEKRPGPDDDEPPPLHAPNGGRLTNEFLDQVARAYRAAVRRGEWPAPAIAAQAGVSVHAARKWIYTARKRGIMESGRQGVVS